jgi:hypothetical protein
MTGLDHNQRWGDILTQLIELIDFKAVLTGPIEQREFGEFLFRHELLQSLELILTGQDLRLPTAARELHLAVRRDDWLELFVQGEGISALYQGRLDGLAQLHDFQQRVGTSLFYELVLVLEKNVVQQSLQVGPCDLAVL